MPDILTKTTQTVEWDGLRSATEGVKRCPKVTYEEVSRITLEDLDKKGWCIWRCDLLDGEKITVVRDRRIFDKQLRFSDPLRIASRYPVYTVEELRDLVGKDDRSIQVTYEVKKCGPAEIEKDETIARERS